MKLFLKIPCILFCFGYASIFAQTKPSELKLGQLDSISTLLLKSKDFEQLLPHAELVINVSKSEKVDTNTAKRFYILGIAQEKNQLWEASEQSYLRSSQIFEQQLPLSEHHAKVLNRLGRLNYYIFQKRDQSEILWKKVLQIRKKVLGTQHPNYAISLMSLGALHYEKGEYAQAEDFFLRAMSIQEKSLGTKHIHYANSLKNLSNLYSEQGQYGKAISLSEQALEIIRENYGNTHPVYAKAIEQLGILYYDMDAYPKAKAYYNLALKIQKKAAPNSPEYAYTLIALADVCTQLEEYPKAKTHALEALGILEKTRSPKDPHYVHLLTSLASIYLGTGEYQKSEKLYVNNIQLIDEIYSIRHPYYINALNNVAQMFLKTKQPLQARAYLQQAINNNSTLNLSRHVIDAAWQDSLKGAIIISLPEFFTSLEVLFRLVQEENTPQSKIEGMHIHDLAFYWFNQFKNNTNSSEDKLRVLKKNSAWVLQSLNLLDHKKEAAKAFSIAEQNKSVLLLDAIQSNQDYQLGNLPDSIIQEQKDLQIQLANIKAQLIEKNAKNAVDELRAQLNHLNLALSNLNKRIQAKHPKYTAFKNAELDIQAPDIQALLPTETALIEYVVGVKSIYIFYLDQQKIQLIEVPISEKEVEQKTYHFHQLLSDYQAIIDQREQTMTEYVEYAHWFHQKLIAPIAIPNQIKHIIVVPDGKLGHLPFETFLSDSVSGSSLNYTNLPYLMNRYCISYSYSAALWKENKQKNTRSNNQKILGIAANYTLQLDSNSTENRPLFYQNLRQSLPLLPNANKEVALMADAYQGTFAFDLDASEKYFKAKAKDYSILHLAMHGILNNKNPMLSSLVFTEDSDSLENNFLQAYEISNLELNADLVVLSACETGYGKFQKGNGLASLARAFMYAGTSSLVVSLWQVNDYATSKIMQNFYQNLAAGMNKPEALRLAKQAYIKDAVGILSHPAFWSPFIQLGNEAPIKIYSKKGNYNYWLIGGGLFMVLIGGLYYRLRKPA
jgi:CHAT domain-containing protein